ncbi:MAG: hypothetical protein LBH91_05770 [Prevotellaceae bacterium]|jgi:hypothetical protein|nr:hypothetical protein [Prevotellaceae bacterium]
MTRDKLINRCFTSLRCVQHDVSDGGERVGVSGGFAAAHTDLPHKTMRSFRIKRSGVRNLLDIKKL